MSRTFLLVVAIALAGCTYAGQPASLGEPSPTESVTATPHPSASARPSATPEPTLPDWINRTPSPECINPPPDLMTVIFTADRIECYGRTPLTLEGVVGGIGTYDPVLYTEPAWLGMPGSTLFAIVEGIPMPEPVALVTFGGEAARPSTTVPPDLWIVADPASGIDLGDYMLQVVRVVGHFDDPAAASCHYTEDYSSLGYEADDCIWQCRNQFVVTEIARLS